MAGEITQFRLGDRCVVKSSKRVFAEEYVQFGIPFFRSKDVIDKALGEFHRYDLFISEKRYRELKETHGSPRKGDVLISSVGNRSGQPYVVKDDGEFYFKDGNIIWLSEFKELDPLCLSYWLKSTDGQHALSSVMIGSAQKALTIDSLRKLAVELPPLGEQEAIAAVLGALDDKIELNRRMNATLEAMARALFQCWFVDFDPVRAKLEGRPPAALDPATAALFPASFHETELGHIPHGWTAGNFGEVIAAERERIGESDAVVLSAVASSQLVRSDEHFNKQVYSKSISNYLKVRRWDFAYNPSRINIGSIGMLKESFIGAVSPVYEVFRPKAAYHWFVERSLAQADTKVWIQTLCSGSVRQSLKLRDLESIPLVVPPPPIVQAFNKTWEQWHDLIQANERESRTLATLRDTLLPKLLSGELRVAANNKMAGKLS